MTSIRAVIRSIDSGESNRRILRVMFDKSRERARGKELSYLKALSYKMEYELLGLSADEIDEMAIGSSHGGIIMETTDRVYPTLSANIIKKDFPSTDRLFFAMVEGVEDPYNFGYAIRSLYAAGVSAVILTPRNWMNAAGVVCRASAGASELCKMYVADSKLCASVMKEFGVKIICCDMKNSVSIYDADLSLPLLLAIGGEKRGLSRDMLDNADSVIRLEYGRDTNIALSAASASAIAANEVMRKNLLFRKDL